MIPGISIHDVPRFKVPRAKSLALTLEKTLNLSSLMESWPVDFVKNRLDYKRLSPRFFLTPVAGIGLAYLDRMLREFWTIPEPYDPSLEIVCIYFSTSMCCRSLSTSATATSTILTSKVTPRLTDSSISPKLGAIRVTEDC